MVISNGELARLEDILKVKEVIVPVNFRHELVYEEPGLAGIVPDLLKDSPHKPNKKERIFNNFLVYSLKLLGKKVTDELKEKKLVVFENGFGHRVGKSEPEIDKIVDKKVLNVGISKLNFPYVNLMCNSIALNELKFGLPDIYIGQFIHKLKPLLYTDKEMYDKYVGLIDLIENEELPENLNISNEERADLDEKLVRCLLDNSLNFNLCGGLGNNFRTIISSNTDFKFLDFINNQIGHLRKKTELDNCIYNTDVYFMPKKDTSIILIEEKEFSKDIKKYGPIYYSTGVLVEGSNRMIISCDKRSINDEDRHSLGNINYHINLRTGEEKISSGGNIQCTQSRTFSPVDFLQSSFNILYPDERKIIKENLEGYFSIK